MQLALGIDIGGTSTKLALVDTSGNITARSSFSTADRLDEHDFFRYLFAGIDELMKDGLVQLVGIGAGAPSANEQQGTIENAANLPFSPKVEFVNTVRARYKVPVLLVKDSNASTLGEWHFGAAKGMENFMLLTLGTGLGCGIVADGRLLGGEFGHGGEAGHVCVQPKGRACGCGRFGCLETYVSATGLKRTVFENLAYRMEDSPLRSISYEAMTARHIFEAALFGRFFGKKNLRANGRGAGPGAGGHGGMVRTSGHRAVRWAGDGGRPAVCADHREPGAPCAGISQGPQNQGAALFVGGKRCGAAGGGGVGLGEEE
ncbi:MAG: ROK family protein [Saprospiraceae bacterium]|nr:ROK family protein [Saprospiraceae bacterium]